MRCELWPLSEDGVVLGRRRLFLFGRDIDENVRLASIAVIVQGKVATWQKGFVCLGEGH